MYCPTGYVKDAAAGFMPAFQIPTKNFLIDFERGHKARAYGLKAASLQANPFTPWFRIVASVYLWGHGCSEEAFRAAFPFVSRARSAVTGATWRVRQKHRPAGEFEPDRDRHFVSGSRREPRVRGVLQTFPAAWLPVPEIYAEALE